MRQKKRNCAGRFFIRLAVFILAISVVIFYIFCLTSSTYTNPHIPPIFLAQIQKLNTSIQIGFYGICTSPSSSSPACITTISHSTDDITASLFPNQDPATATDITSLVSFALDLQRKILLSPFPIAAGLFLLSLFFTALTRLVGKRQRHLMPGRRLRYLKTFTLGLVWLSTSLALAAAVLAMEGVHGIVYVVSNVGNGDLNVTAGGLLQVLLWVVFGVETVFSIVVMVVLRDERGGRAADEGRIMGVERQWQEFEDDHIIVI